MQDPQAEKAYDWEASFGHSTIQGLKNIHYGRNWVKWACKQYKVPVPTVVLQIKGRNFSGYRPIDHRIWLHKPHLNVWTALHEAAHAIARHLFDDWTHGPKWLGIYIYLLSTAGIAPYSALSPSAKSMGLRHSYLGNVGADKVRKRMRVLAN
jgi:hypothetical protein